MRSSIRALEIRPVRADDILRVAEIEASCYTTPWSAEAFRSLVGRPRVRFDVAELTTEASRGGTDGAAMVAGYGILLNAGEEADLVNLAVDPALRGRGLGAALLEHVVEEARRAGVRAVFLEVRASNAAAIGLYSTRGFRQIATREHYYERPTEDARVLRKLLTK